MKYKDTVEPLTKEQIAMARRDYETSEKEDRLVAKQKKAKKKSKNFATSADGYAKGGMVMKSKKSKKSKKPPGSGCAARTKRTKKY
jgi:hypothetical protein